MKKKFSAFLILAFITAVFAAGCGKNHFGPYASAISDLISAKEKLAADAGSATSAQALAASMKALSSSIDAFTTTRTDLFMKYPALTDRGPFPDNIRGLLEKSAKLDEKIDSVLLQAIEKYQGYEGVLAAWNELNGKRSSL